MKQNSFQISFRVASVLCAAVLLVAAARSHADEPTTAPSEAPAIIQVSDAAALAAHQDQEVVIEGVCSTAAWSGTGKVMNVRFEGTQESKLSAALFQKNREKLDTAFGGDVIKAWTGAKLRIKGKLREFKGRPEITITEPSQVTVVELPATQPS